MQNRGSLILALSAVTGACAGPTDDTHMTRSVDIEISHAGKQEKKEIPCPPLRGLSSQSIEGLTQLDSLIHDYEGNVYLDLTARSAAAEAAVKSNPEVFSGKIRQMFNGQYTIFDNLPEDGKLHWIQQKLGTHQVTSTKIDYVFETCEAQ